MVTALLVVLVSALQATWGQITIDPSTEVLVNATESVSIECSHPNENATISWGMGSVAISDGTGGFDVSTSALGAGVLTILSANAELHTGNYTCTATLPGGNQEMEDFTLLVQFIGAVSVTVTTEVCAEGMVYLDSEVILDCVVSDAVPPIGPAATVWFREGTPPMLVTEAGPGRVNLTGTKLVINATSVSSADYFCQASNGPLTRNSGLQNIAVITRAPPRRVELEYQGIIRSPREEVLAKQGARTTINCLIRPPFPRFTDSDVSWTRNGGGLSSSSDGYILFSNPQPCNFTLIITNTRPENEGLFSCRLRRDAGVIETSAGISLRLAKIPQTYSLTSMPPNTSILGENMAISFRCIPDPPPPVQSSNVLETISWEFISAVAGAQPVPVVGDGERVVVVVENRTLTIRRLLVEDSGRFVCVAGHVLVNPVRTSFDLTVEASLPVSITPTLPEVRLGTPLTLTCIVMSSRPATFSWSIGNTTVVPSDRLVVTNTSSESVLRITSLSRNDLGAVLCTVSDPLHLPLVNSTVVMETNQLYFFGDRTQRTMDVLVGVPLMLECPIRARSESTVVRWFARNRELSDGNGVQFITSENGSSVVSLGHMVSLEEDDGDEYLCVVADGGIQLQYDITLFVTVPGNITSLSPMVTATLESRVQLDCRPSGRPLPRVLWFQGSINLTAQSNATITDTGNGSLVFKSVSEEDAGTYICVITNPPIQRRTILMVEEKPPSSSGGVLGLNRDETFLVFVMVGLVVIFLLIMLILLIVICLCGLLDRVSRGKYMVSKAASGYNSASFKHDSVKGSSMRRDNADIFMGTGGTPIFDTLQRSSEPQFVDPVERRVTLDESIHLHTFDMRSASLLTDSQPSSPQRGTMVTTPSHTSVSSPLRVPDMDSMEMFSSEGPTFSLENGQLPNFPRINVRLEELMGQGEFGPVMKAVARDLVPGESETEVAVKLLVTEAVEDTGFRPDLAMVDYANHMKLRNQNIAAILGVCSDKEPYYVMYEYLDKGDLKNFLLSCRPEEGVPPKLMQHELLHMIGQVADGMAYLFSQRIIHGDIATRNCLVSSSLQVKIGDLGIGHELYTGDYYDNGAQLLPIRWMPPELLVESEEGPSFSLHSDTWSFGVFCWEVMALGKLPYENYSDEDVLAMVPAGSRLRSPGHACPPALHLVMMECWEEVPDARPQFSRILSAIAAMNVEER